MSKIKNVGLDQYGAEPFEQQQFGTAGVEGVNTELQFVAAPKSLTVEFTRRQVTPMEFGL